MLKKFLFWQPKINFYHFLFQHRLGRFLLVLSNYLTWAYFFYLSMFLVQKDANIFWQLLLITISTELIEKYCKVKNFWRRPAFQSEHKLPRGLIKTWYTNGSFPSGHAIKATYFLLFILGNNIPSLSQFLIIVTPLLLFRVLVGFHYPIDMLGGVLIGGLSWAFVGHLIFPTSLVELARNLFHFFFFFM